MKIFLITTKTGREWEVRDLGSTRAAEFASPLIQPKTQEIKDNANFFASVQREWIFQIKYLETAFTAASTQILANYRFKMLYDGQRKSPSNK